MQQTLCNSMLAAAREAGRSMPLRLVGPCSCGCCILPDAAAVCCCCGLEDAPHQVGMAAWLLPARWVPSSISLHGDLGA